MVDFATQYPEAVLLCKAMPQISTELILLFTLAGISNIFSTDQGIPFVLN